MSTQPGATNSPDASTSRCPRPSTFPTTATFPSRTATSASRNGAPVPSATIPPRTTRSKSCVLTITPPHRRSLPPSDPRPVAGVSYRHDGGPGTGTRLEPGAAPGRRLVPGDLAIRPHAARRGVARSRRAAVRRHRYLLPPQPRRTLRVAPGAFGRTVAVAPRRSVDPVPRRGRLGTGAGPRGGAGPGRRGRRTPSGGGAGRGVAGRAPGRRRGGVGVLRGCARLRVRRLHPDRRVIRADVRPPGPGSAHPGAAGPPRRTRPTP